MNRSVMIIMPVVLAACLVGGVALVRVQNAAAERDLLEEKLAATEAAMDSAQRELDSVRQKLGETQLAAAEADADARQSIVDLQAKLVQAESQFANGSAAAADDWEDLSPGGGDAVVEAEAPADGKKGFGAMLESMFKDENMKKMMRQSQMAMLDRTYGKLFSDLGLPEDRLASLKALIVERQMAGAERGMSLLTVGNDKEKMAELIDEIKLQREAVDAEIAALLDPAQYETFQTYDETLGERMQVSQFAGAAQAVGEPLTAEQTESLISLMHDSNRDVFGDDFNQQDPSVGIRMMQQADGAEDMLGKLETANQQLVERSKSILTPGQQDAFVKHQEQQAQMQKVGMEMMRGMMKTEAE